MFDGVLGPSPEVEIPDEILSGFTSESHCGSEISPSPDSNNDLAETLILGGTFTATADSAPKEG